MAESVECLVIGAGAIGLAIGRSLAKAGREVIVAEAERGIGTQTSSRNSEVIHAGIYYPTGSMKAGLCVRGKRLLYRYCEKHDVPHEKIGKLIVATSADEIPRLHEYREQALRNGVEDIVLMDTSEVRVMEPSVTCVAGLWSPSTGILDSHAYMLALLADFESAGGIVALGNKVRRIRTRSGRFIVELGHEQASEIGCEYLVNSAGLSAQEIAHSIDGLGEENIPPLFLAKGHYFAYAEKAQFKHLIYPVPEGGGLGVHVTKDMGGRFKFGPDVQWIDTIDYQFDESRKHAFAEAIRKYFTELNEDALIPDFTGIRPKLVPPGKPPADFVIHDQHDHGIRGLVNLFGIESPGLTASLAIAEQVNDRLSSDSHNPSC